MITPRSKTDASSIRIQDESPVSLFSFRTVSVLALFLRCQRKLFMPTRCLAVIPSTIVTNGTVVLYYVDASLEYMWSRMRTSRCYCNWSYLAFSQVVSITSSYISSFTTTYIFLRYPSYELGNIPSLKTIAAILCTFLLIDSSWGTSEKDFFAY